MRLLVVVGVLVLGTNIVALWRPAIRRLAGVVTCGYGIWLLYFALTERGTPPGLLSYGNPWGDMDLGISILALIIGGVTLLLPRWRKR